jgi:oligosaccharide repeat unit polymerase
VGAEPFIILAALLLVALGVLGRRVGDSWLFPPACFGITWAGYLVYGLLVSFGDLRLTPSSLVVFVVGAAMVLVSSMLVWIRWRLPPSVHPTPVVIAPDRGILMRRVVIAYSVGLFLVLPSFIGEIRSAMLELDIEDFAVAGRTIRTGEGIDLVPRFYQSLISVGSVLTLLMAWIYDGRRRDRWLFALSLASTLALLIPTFGRTPIFVLVLGAGSILFFRRMIPTWFAIVGVVALLAGGIAIGSALGKGLASSGSSSLIASVAENIGIYFVGGPVGFAHVMERPESVGEHGLSLRIFTQALQSFGFDITLPHNILGYDRMELGNVYTMYFAYWLDWRWVGVIVVGFGYGAVATWLYTHARRGNPIAGVGMGLVFPSIINSATGDGMFASSIPWLLIAVIVGSLWKLPVPRWVTSPMRRRDRAAAGA